MSKNTQILIISVFKRSHHGESQPMCTWQYVARLFLRRGIVSPLPNFQAEGPLVVGYPLLFVNTLAHTFRVWRTPIQSSVWGHSLPRPRFAFGYCEDRYWTIRLEFRLSLIRGESGTLPLSIYLWQSTIRTSDARSLIVVDSESRIKTPNFVKIRSGGS
jgi:hypothetical protein